MSSARVPDYLGEGLFENRPTTLDLYPGTLGLWFSSDTEVLSVWANGVWTDVEAGGSVITPAPVSASTATSENLEASLSGSYRVFDATSAKTLTVRPESEHALPANGEWFLENRGASNLTVAPGVGVLIAPPKGGTLVLEPGDTALLKRRGSDDFKLIGGTASA